MKLSAENEKSVKIKIYHPNSFYRESNMQCCIKEVILELKRDFYPYFSAKIFERPHHTLLIPKIYIFNYKKVYGTIQIFGNLEKMLANLRIFGNFRFMRGNYSKPPFSRKNWHLFIQFIPHFSIKTFYSRKRH